MSKQPPYVIKQEFAMVLEETLQLKRKTLQAFRNAEESLLKTERSIDDRVYAVQALEDLEKALIRAKAYIKVDVPYVSWVEYEGGYIWIGEDRHYFYIRSETSSHPFQIRIPGIQETDMYNLLEHAVQESIERGERPKQ